MVMQQLLAAHCCLTAGQALLHNVLQAQQYEQSVAKCMQQEVGTAGCGEEAEPEVSITVKHW